MNWRKDVEGVEETRLLTYKVYVSMGNNSVKIRILVQGQLVEPAICFSDLCNVFVGEREANVLTNCQI